MKKGDFTPKQMVSVLLEKPEYEALNQLAETQGITRSEVLRNIIKSSLRGLNEI